MTRRLIRLLCPMLLLVSACGSDSSGSPTGSAARSTSPSAPAGCAPRTVTFEAATDGSSPAAAVPPEGDEALAAAVADTFCSTEWVFVQPDGSEQTIAARGVLAGDDAACIADGLIELLGAGRVLELGLGAGPWSLLGFGLSGNSSGNSIERAEAASIVEVFRTCSDQWKRLLILSITEGSDGISDDSAACVADHLADDDAARLLVGEIDRAYDDPGQPGAESFADSIAPLLAAFDGCLTPTERGNLDFD